ncbi:MAG: competence/damage-inducible protein A [Rickettsiales bacterium]
MQATACLIIIGNEILSGRTEDKNLAWIAKALNECGVALTEVRVIPDVEATIVDTVNFARKNFTYVFTTGGIGPTHDDITSSSIAKAFGVPLLRHPEAERRLLGHYKPDQVNEARMKMADIPQGGALIDNPVSLAPGFRLENVFVLAGVPRIMQAMFDGIKDQLKGGDKTLSKSYSAYVTEGTLAAGLGEIQKRYPQVEIGSYPFVRDGKLGTSLVARTPDKGVLDACMAEIRSLLLKFTDDIREE